MNPQPPAPSPGADGPTPLPAPLTAPLTAPPAPQTTRSRLRPILGFTIGAALLAAAITAVLTQGHAARAALDAARGAPLWLYAAALALPLVNWLIISLSFWVLMRRHGPVRAREMAALIGAAWLLNYLPLRPGMVGRVAYHKSVNRIAIADSVRVMIVGMAAGAAATLCLLAAAAILGPGAPLPLWAAALAAPLALAGLAAAGPLRSRPWLPANFALRYADVLVWAARYWVVFALVGAPIDLAGAAAVAAVCQLALVIPLVGNGMGIREWAVGLVAAALPAGFASGAALTTGVTADLANRAAELLIALPVGLLCASYLARGSAARGERRESPATASPGTPP